MNNLIKGEHTLQCDSTTQVNTQCDLELSAFTLVAPVLLFAKPYS